MNLGIPSLTRASIEAFARSNDPLMVAGTWVRAEPDVWVRAEPHVSALFESRIISMKRLARRTALPESVAVVMFYAEPAYVLDDLSSLAYYQYNPLAFCTQVVSHQKEAEDAFAQARRTLADVDESETDIAVAKDLAYRVLAQLIEAALVPDRVLPTRDADIAFYFFSAGTIEGGAHRRFARLGCSVDGITVMLEDRLDGTRTVTETHSDDMALDQVIAHVQGFLS